MAAIPMAVPVAVAVPALAVEDNGTTWLGQFAGLFIRQKIELFEAVSGCETKNRYNIVPIDKSTPIPGYVTSSFTKPLRAASEAMPLLKAKEESDCLQRQCCPLFREFKMSFQDGAGNTFFSLDRPFTCEPCGCYPCFFLASQNLTMLDKAGAPIAKAYEPVKPCSRCCSRSFTVEDQKGEVMYTMVASECGTKNSNNLCAPTCFNESYDIDVFGPDGSYINSSTFVFPGCNCSALMDRSHFVVNFPEGADGQKRAGLVAGMMLIEYTVMEMRRQQEKNNNGGGGGGGAPPKNEEMQR